MELQTITKTNEATAIDPIAAIKKLIADMLAALKKQPNISNIIKQGLPKLEDLVEGLPAMMATKPSPPRPVAPAIRAIRRARSISLPEGESNKRAATSPPQTDSKRPRNETASANECWTEVGKKGKRKAKGQNKPAHGETRKGLQKKAAEAQIPGGAKKPTPRARSPGKEKAPETRRKNKKRRQKPDAILLKPTAGKSYADIVSAIHAKIKPDEMGVDVRSVRRTRAGGVLLELGRTSVEVRATFSAALKQTVDVASEVAEMVPKSTVEIRDCDCCTTETEIEEALRRVIPEYSGQMKVKLTRPNSRQQRLALIKMEAQAVKKILDAGRILIGFVSCRVREGAEVQRCFRCLGYGHHAAGCKGPDRSKLCHRCGGADHKGSDCTADPLCFLCAAADRESAKHVAGTRACKAFREALAEVNKK